MDEEYAMETEEAADGEADGEGPVASGSGLPWDGTDRDYKYEELLGKQDTGLYWCCLTLRFQVALLCHLLSYLLAFLVSYQFAAHEATVDCTCTWRHVMANGNGPMKGSE